MSPSKDTQTLPDNQRENSYAVSPGSAPLRLDSFLRQRFPHLSLRRIRGAVEAGEVFVNGRPGNKGRNLFSGDVVSFKIPSPWLGKFPLPNAQLRVPILYEDEAFLVVDKPAGMACHGFSGSETQTLANFLLARYPSLINVGKSRWEPGLVHRLDRGTSGLVLVAKDQVSFESLRAQFRRRLVRKRYAALVRGRTPDQGRVSYSLAHDPKDKRKMSVVPAREGSNSEVKQWKAATRFQTLARSEGFSFIQIEMYTGVTHQIRAHLEAAGYPLAGDPLYYGEVPDSTFPRGRQFLHACSLELRHPRSGDGMTFQSPLPEDLREALDRIGIASSKLPYL